MEHTWRIRGTQATWSLTLRAEPPESEWDDEPPAQLDLPRFPPEPFTRLDDTFRDAIDLHELRRDLNQAHRTRFGIA